MSKNKLDKSFIIISILDILVIICFFLAYGPISYFRDLLITSAMTTASHQYFAYILYNDKIINDTMKQNVVISFEEGTNVEEIKFNNDVEITEYANEYEEAVLKRDEGNDLYKVIEYKYKGDKGYIFVVYDPSRITMENSPRNARGGQLLINLVKSFEGIAGVNASGFTRNANTGAITPMGITISHGKIITNVNGSRDLIGFNNDNVLVLSNTNAETAIKNGIRDAVSFTPFLIVNGVKANMKGDGGWGYAPRTSIAQRKDGIVLFTISDGRGKGAKGLSMVELADMLLQYGAYNAANLDGGGSSTLVVNNKLINDPGGWGYTGSRYLCNAWILK